MCHCLDEKLGRSLFTKDELILKFQYGILCALEDFTAVRDDDGTGHAYFAYLLSHEDFGKLIFER